MAKHCNTTCKTKTKNGKKGLRYHNTKSRKNYPIVVGKMGGLYVKTPKSKTRRYVKSVCKKTTCGPNFWNTLKSILKSRKIKKQ
tara:strand:- start:423 stop:674 length:252 start_codon:yes stop_codon:yes gene_type:complete